MSCSKPLPPFVCDSLYYLNRDQLERFTIVCRPLKSFIERYRHSKPYRIFDRLYIFGGSYQLYHNDVIWHPNRGDYSAQQFLAGQECSIDEPEHLNEPELRDLTYYSFAEMRPFLSSTIRIETTSIDASEDSTYNSDHIIEMESISYLWRDYDIDISRREDISILAKDLQPILNSPTILQCRQLDMLNAHFSFKDYKVLYNVQVVRLTYFDSEFVDPNHWADFLEQPGNKPIVVFYQILPQEFDNLLARLKKDFSSAVVPNAFKIVFDFHKEDYLSFKDDFEERLTEFQDTNKASSETLEVKKGFPAELLVEYQKIEDLEDLDSYTLERSTI